MSSVIAANCLSTVTAYSALCRTPRTRCRRLCFVPGGIATASRKARRYAHGPTAWPRTPASKVRLWCGSQHRPKHFNEGTYAVVTDCDSDLRDRYPLCQHLKGSKQPRLLPPQRQNAASSGAGVKFRIDNVGLWASRPVRASTGYSNGNLVRALLMKSILV